MLPIRWTKHAIDRAMNRFGPDPSIIIPNEKMAWFAERCPSGCRFTVKCDGVCYVCAVGDGVVWVVTVYKKRRPTRKAGAR